MAKKERSAARRQAVLLPTPPTYHSPVTGGRLTGRRPSHGGRRGAKSAAESGAAGEPLNAAVQGNWGTGGSGAGGAGPQHAPSPWCGPYAGHTYHRWTLSNTTAPGGRGSDDGDDQDGAVSTRAEAGGDADERPARGMVLTTSHGARDDTGADGAKRGRGRGAASGRRRLTEGSHRGSKGKIPRRRGARAVDATNARRKRGAAAGEFGDGRDLLEAVADGLHLHTAAQAPSAAPISSSSHSGDYGRRSALGRTGPDAAVAAATLPRARDETERLREHFVASQRALHRRPLCPGPARRAMERSASTPSAVQADAESDAGNESYGSLGAAVMVSAPLSIPRRSYEEDVPLLSCDRPLRRGGSLSPPSPSLNVGVAAGRAGGGAAFGGATDGTPRLSESFMLRTGDRSGGARSGSRLSRFGGAAGTSTWLTSPTAFLVSPEGSPVNRTGQRRVDRAGAAAPVSPQAKQPKRSGRGPSSSRPHAAAPPPSHDAAGATSADTRRELHSARELLLLAGGRREAPRARDRAGRRSDSRSLEDDRDGSRHSGSPLLLAGDATRPTVVPASSAWRAEPAHDAIAERHGGLPFSYHVSTLLDNQGRLYSQSGALVLSQAPSSAMTATTAAAVGNTTSNSGKDAIQLARKAGRESGRMTASSAPSPPPPVQSFAGAAGKEPTAGYRLPVALSADGEAAVTSRGRRHARKKHKKNARGPRPKSIPQGESACGQPSTGGCRAAESVPAIRQRMAHTLTPLWPPMLSPFDRVAPSPVSRVSGTSSPSPVCFTAKATGFVPGHAGHGYRGAGEDVPSETNTTGAGSSRSTAARRALYGSGATSAQAVLRGPAPLAAQNASIAAASGEEPTGASAVASGRWLLSRSSSFRQSGVRGSFSANVGGPPSQRATAGSPALRGSQLGSTFRTIGSANEETSSAKQEALAARDGSLDGPTRGDLVQFSARDARHNLRHLTQLDRGFLGDGGRHRSSSTASLSNSGQLQGPTAEHGVEAGDRYHKDAHPASEGKHTNEGEEDAGVDCAVRTFMLTAKALTQLQEHVREAFMALRDEEAVQRMNSLARDDDWKRKSTPMASEDSAGARGAEATGLLPSPFRVHDDERTRLHLPAMADELSALPQPDSAQSPRPPPRAGAAAASRTVLPTTSLGTDTETAAPTPAAASAGPVAVAHDPRALSAHSLDTPASCGAADQTNSPARPMPLDDATRLEDGRFPSGSSGEEAEDGAVWPLSFTGARSSGQSVGLHRRTLTNRYCDADSLQSFATAEVEDVPVDVTRVESSMETGTVARGGPQNSACAPALSSLDFSPVALSTGQSDGVSPPHNPQAMAAAVTKEEDAVMLSGTSEAADAPRDGSQAKAAAYEPLAARVWPCSKEEGEEACSWCLADLEPGDLMLSDAFVEDLQRNLEAAFLAPSSAALPHPLSEHSAAAFHRVPEDCDGSADHRQASSTSTEARPVVALALDSPKASVQSGPHGTDAHSPPPPPLFVSEAVRRKLYLTLPVLGVDVRATVTAASTLSTWKETTTAGTTADTRKLSRRGRESPSQRCRTKASARQQAKGSRPLKSTGRASERKSAKPLPSASGRGPRTRLSLRSERASTPLSPLKSLPVTSGSKERSPSHRWAPAPTPDSSTSAVFSVGAANVASAAAARQRAGSAHTSGSAAQGTRDSRGRVHGGDEAMRLSPNCAPLSTSSPFLCSVPASPSPPPQAGTLARRAVCLSSFRPEEMVAVVALAQPYVTSGNIRAHWGRLLRQSRPSPVRQEETLRNIARAVLQRLVALHAMGYAHGSVKATNIFPLAGAQQATERCNRAVTRGAPDGQGRASGKARGSLGKASDPGELPGVLGRCAADGEEEEEEEDGDDEERVEAMEEDEGCADAQSTDNGSRLTSTLFKDSSPTSLTKSNGQHPALKNRSAERASKSHGTARYHDDDAMEGAASSVDNSSKTYQSPPDDDFGVGGGETPFLSGTMLPAASRSQRGGLPRFQGGCGSPLDATADDNSSNAALVPRGSSPLQELPLRQHGGRVVEVPAAVHVAKDGEDHGGALCARHPHPATAEASSGTPLAPSPGRVLRTKHDQADATSSRSSRSSRSSSSSSSNHSSRSGHSIASSSDSGYVQRHRHGPRQPRGKAGGRAVGPSNLCRREGGLVALVGAPSQREHAAIATRAADGQFMPGLVELASDSALCAPTQPWGLHRVLVSSNRELTVDTTAEMSSKELEDPESAALADHDANAFLSRAETDVKLSEGGNPPSQMSSSASPYSGAGQCARTLPAPARSVSLQPPDPLAWTKEVVLSDEFYRRVEQVLLITVAQHMLRLRSQPLSVSPSPPPPPLPPSSHRSPLPHPLVPTRVPASPAKPPRVPNPELPLAGRMAVTTSADGSGRVSAVLADPGVLPRRAAGSSVDASASQLLDALPAVSAALQEYISATAERTAERVCSSLPAGQRHAMLLFGLEDAEGIPPPELMSGDSGFHGSLLGPLGLEKGSGANPSANATAARTRPPPFRVTPNTRRPRAAATQSGDIWQVGTLLLELAHATLPIDDHHRIRSNAVAMFEPQLMLRRLEMSRRLFRFIRRCVAIDPQKRPSAAQLLEDEWMRATLVQEFGDAQVWSTLEEINGWPVGSVVDTTRGVAADGSRPGTEPHTRDVHGGRGGNSGALSDGVAHTHPSAATLHGARTGGTGVGPGLVLSTPLQENYGLMSLGGRASGEGRPLSNPSGGRTNAAPPPFTFAWRSTPDRRVGADQRASFTMAGGVVVTSAAADELLGRTTKAIPPLVYSFNVAAQQWVSHNTPWLLSTIHPRQQMQLCGSRAVGQWWLHEAVLAAAGTDRRPTWIPLVMSIAYLPPGVDAMTLLCSRRSPDSLPLDSAAGGPAATALVAGVMAAADGSATRRGTVTTALGAQAWFALFGGLPNASAPTTPRASQRRSGRGGESGGVPRSVSAGPAGNGGAAVPSRRLSQSRLAATSGTGHSSSGMATPSSSWPPVPERPARGEQRGRSARQAHKSRDPSLDSGAVAAAADHTTRRQHHTHRQRHPHRHRRQQRAGTRPRQSREDSHRAVRERDGSHDGGTSSHRRHRGLAAAPYPKRDKAATARAVEEDVLGFGVGATGMDHDGNAVNSPARTASAALSFSSDTPSSTRSLRRDGECVEARSARDVTAAAGVWAEKLHRPAGPTATSLPPSTASSASTTPSSDSSSLTSRSSMYDRRGGAGGAAVFTGRSGRRRFLQRGRLSGSRASTLTSTTDRTSSWTSSSSFSSFASSSLSSSSAVASSAALSSFLRAEEKARDLYAAQTLSASRSRGSSVRSRASDAGRDRYGRTAHSTESSTNGGHMLTVNVEGAETPTWLARTSDRKAPAATAERPSTASSAAERRRRLLERTENNRRGTSSCADTFLSSSSTALGVVTSASYGRPGAYDGTPDTIAAALPLTPAGVSSRDDGDNGDAGQQTPGVLCLPSAQRRPREPAGKDDSRRAPSQDAHLPPQAPRGAGPRLPETTAPSASCQAASSWGPAAGEGEEDGEVTAGTPRKAVRPPLRSGRARARRPGAGSSSGRPLEQRHRTHRHRCRKLAAPSLLTILVRATDRSTQRLLLRLGARVSPPIALGRGGARSSGRRGEEEDDDGTRSEEDCLDELQDRLANFVQSFLQLQGRAPHLANLFGVTLLRRWAQDGRSAWMVADPAVYNALFLPEEDAAVQAAVAASRARLAPLPPPPAPPAPTEQRQAGPAVSPPTAPSDTLPGAFHAYEVCKWVAALESICGDPTKSAASRV